MPHTNQHSNLYICIPFLITGPHMAAQPRQRHVLAYSTVALESLALWTHVAGLTLIIWAGGRMAGLGRTVAGGGRAGRMAGRTDRLAGGLLAPCKIWGRKGVRVALDAFRTVTERWRLAQKPSEHVYIYVYVTLRETAKSIPPALPYTYIYIYITEEL